MALFKDPLGAAEAESELRLALELDSGFQEARLDLARALAQKGEFREAAAHYQKAVETDPNNSGIRVAHVRCLSRSGQLAEASVALRELLVLDPENLEARVLLGPVLVQSGDVDGAVSTLQWVISQDDVPPNLLAMAHLHLANVEQDRGRTEVAMKHYRLATELKDDLPDAHFNLAVDLLNKGLFEEAAGRFGKVVELTPQDESAHVGRVSALLQARLWARAGWALDEGLAALPGNGELSLLLSELLSTVPVDEVRNPERAMTLARTLITTQPSPRHAEAVGLALAALGRWQEAEAWQAQLLDQAQRGEAPPEMTARMRLNLERFRSRKLGFPPWMPF